MNNDYAIPAKKELRIAISGASGCGNTTVSTLLADTLGIPCINYTFRSLAKELDMPLKQLLNRPKPISVLTGLSIAAKLSKR